MFTNYECTLATLGLSVMIRLHETIIFNKENINNTNKSNMYH